VKSTYLARQAVMHDVCNAPGGADCPVKDCDECVYNKLNEWRVKFLNQLVVEKIAKTHKKENK
jgi:hypothetical protein